MRVVAVLVVVAFAHPALGYVRTTDRVSGACLFWTNREVPWVLNEKGSADVPLEELRAALDRSFAEWQDVACTDVSFRFDGLTPRIDARFDRTAADNVNLLVWREVTCDEAAPATDPCWTDDDRTACADVYDCWTHGPGIIALTTLNYAQSTGVIWDGDIEFNGAPEPSGTEFRYTATVADSPVCTSPTETDCVSTDVQNTATHEIGHLLGFGHTPVPDATMFSSAPLGETAKRSLAQDDIDGVCAVYPAGGPPLTCTGSGRITIEEDGDGCATLPGGVASLLVLAIAGSRRRRPNSCA